MERKIMKLHSLRHVMSRLPWARRLFVTARFGDLGRVEPLTPWGVQRGLPVDRWYIEAFLEAHAGAVTGHALEVKEDAYASRLGAVAVDVVDIDADNDQATLVGDLCAADTLEQSRYDIAIVTQTLQLVDDPEAALRNLIGSLKAGGSLLVTVPCLSRLANSSDKWRWTPVGFTYLAQAVAPPGAHIEVRGFGNSLAARAFLFGLAADDLTTAVLEAHDAEVPMVVGALIKLP